MSSVSNSSNPYNLFQEVLTYTGDCSICTNTKQELYSIHQVESDVYDEDIHGPILEEGVLNGIYKDMDIAVTVKKITKVFSSPVFHQVAIGKDAKLHLFSPSHNACMSCIEKIKKLVAAKCPICRYSLVDQKPISYLASRISKRTVSSTRPLIDPGFGGPYAFLDNKDRLFSSLSRPQRKSFLNEFVKNLSEMNKLADIVEEELDESFDDELQEDSLVTHLTQ